MVVIDPAVESVLTSASVGDVEVWRAEKFKLVHVKSKAEQGKFYGGDCYLVYDKKRDRIHYWLGGEASGDERTVVAIKAVELDDYMGGAPVQYR